MNACAGWNDSQRLFKASGSRSCLACRAGTPPETPQYVKRAETLGADAMIAMPPTTATSLDEHDRVDSRALARVTARPTVCTDERWRRRPRAEH